MEHMFLFQFLMLNYSLQGTMRYEVIGIGSAPSFFYVGGNGEIYSRGTLRADRSMDYTVS
jgi:hypothetical protein